jgi:tetratricopeptide (TPR) repeat protein
MLSKIRGLTGQDCECGLRDSAMRKSVRHSGKAAPKSSASKEHRHRGAAQGEAAETRDRNPVASPLNSKEQAALFEKAVSLFHSREFAKARVLFERAADGPVIEMAHSSRVHARICEQRLSRTPPALSTAEEHYNYAIALINQRQLDNARRHLEQAASMNPGADHVYYALALCHALKGEADEVYANLSRAIEIDPRNRGRALRDPDFGDLARRAPLSDLLYPEKERTA